MSSCSIRWCGKTSRTSNYKTDGITFHRFPKDPNHKERWIDCAKRENWFPRNYSVVCSRHFTEDCFYISKSRRRLFDSAIPTLNLPVMTNQIQNQISDPENASPIPSSPRATKRKSTDPENPSQFHSPTTNKRLCRRILQLTSLAKRKNKKIKVLRDKARYYKKRVASLIVIIKELEKKNIIKKEKADI